MHRHLPLVLTSVLVLGMSAAPASCAEDAPIEQQIVDAMNKAFGVHPGFRTNHAKGAVVEGHFVGNWTTTTSATLPLTRRTARPWAR